MNDFDRVRDYKEQYPLATKIFEKPVSFWYGERNGKEMEQIDYSLQRLLRRTAPQLPVLVVYNMPNRDIGQYSKGGAKTRESYLNFLQSFADGIGNSKPILIYEPDSLTHTGDMSTEDASSRMSLMKEGLQLLTDNCEALVYIDIGHSNWLSPEEAANLLNKVSNDKVRGFAVNVSNYRTTDESMEWSLKLCEHRPRDFFVIDTSRNGNGPHGNEWCNPPGRSVGQEPSCDTGEEQCDAFLWIKIPGESDGKLNNGPRAGRFWGEMAEELVKNDE
ncbi:glycoside hydrolase family 6 protein [Hellea sp.]|nr:glycoside hydrolase family 6 protein [Hellea sp.]